MKLSSEEMNREYASKMELLGYLSPYAGEGVKRKDTVEFRTFKKPNRRNGKTYMVIDGSCRIRIPKLQKQVEKGGGITWKLVTNKFTGEVEMEESTILYIPGTRSIFLDDLREETGSKDDELLKRAAAIEIYDGAVTCSYNEQNKIAYLRVFGGNAESRGRMKDQHVMLVYEKDMSSVAQRYVRENLPKHDVIGFVTERIKSGQNAPLWAILAAIRNQSIKDCREIFYETTMMQAQVMKLAKDDPKRLEPIIFSEEGHNKIVILEAIEKGLVKQLADQWVTPEGKGLAYINKGADPIEALVRLIPYAELEALKSKVGDILEGLASDLKERDAYIEQLIARNKQLEKEAELSRAIPTQKLKEMANDKGYSKDQIEEVFAGIKEANGKAPVEFNPPHWFKSDYFPKNEDGTLKSYRPNQLVDHYLEHQSDFAKLITALQEAEDVVE
jgi:hypothetical protein